MSFALDGLGQLLVEGLFKVRHPDVVGRFVHDSRVEKLGGYQEVLMNEVKQILEIGVYTSFGVNGLHV